MRLLLYFVLAFFPVGMENDKAVIHGDVKCMSCPKEVVPFSNDLVCKTGFLGVEGKVPDSSYHIVSIAIT